MSKFDGRAVFFITIFLILVLSLTACGDGLINENNRSAGEPLSHSTPVVNPDATATFGANEFHIQLTATATQEAAPRAP